MDKKKDISVLFKSHPEIVFTDFSFDKKRKIYRRYHRGGSNDRWKDDKEALQIYFIYSSHTILFISAVGNAASKTLATCYCTDVLNLTKKWE